MPVLEESRCPACGANVFTTSGTTQVVCTHCGTPLSVERDQGEVILHGLEAVTGAVREEGQLARENLHRIELGQRRAQLAADLASAQQHRQQLDAEVRALQRAKRNNAANWQLLKLTRESRQTRAHITAISAELRQLEATLAPPSTPRQRGGTRNPSGCVTALTILGTFLIIGVVLVLFANISTHTDGSTTARAETPTVTTAVATAPVQGLAPPTVAATAAPTLVPTLTPTAVSTVAATAMVAALPTAAPTANPVDVALSAELKTYFDEGFVDATWFRHITGVAVVGNLVGVETDYPPGDISRQAAAPICGAASGFAIQHGIPSWQVLIYSNAHIPLIWRHNVGERC